jgi:ribonuclease P protein component
MSLIDNTLQHGKRFFSHPLIMFALTLSDATLRAVAPPSKAIAVAEFSVAKRNIKTAVMRNRLKRRMRAAFRELSKERAIPADTHFVFLYIAKVESPFSLIRTAMQSDIQQFLKQPV